MRLTSACGHTCIVFHFIYIGPCLQAFCFFCCQEEIARFKEEYIYQHIIDTEVKEKAYPCHSCSPDVLVPLVLTFSSCLLLMVLVVLPLLMFTTIVGILMFVSLLLLLLLLLYLIAELFDFLLLLHLFLASTL